MIRKIVSTLFVLIVVSTFAQRETKDKLGIPEAFEFMDAKLLLTRSVTNSDNTITQEYTAHNPKAENADKKTVNKNAEKITITYKGEGEQKELIEKWISKFSEDKTVQNLNIEEMQEDKYKMTYDHVTGKTKEHKTVYFRNVKSDSGMATYVLEYSSGDRKPSEETDVAFFKFMESFLDQ